MQIIFLRGNICLERAIPCNCQIEPSGPIGRHSIKSKKKKLFLLGELRSVSMTLITTYLQLNFIKLSNLNLWLGVMNECAPKFDGLFILGRVKCWNCRPKRIIAQPPCSRRSRNDCDACTAGSPSPCANNGGAKRTNPAAAAHFRVRAMNGFPFMEASRGVIDKGEAVMR